MNKRIFFDLKAMLMNLENNMSPKCNAKNNVTNNRPNNFFFTFY